MDIATGSHTPRAISRPSFRITCAALFAMCGLAFAQEPANLQQQREQFRAAYTAAYNGQNWRALARGLESYPLYPYLEAAALEHDLAHADRTQVQAYLVRYPDLIPADDLRRDELQLLAQQRDWNGFLSFYKPGLGDALTCDALQAQLAQGARLDFQRDLASLWNQSKLPSACDPVLQASAAQGLLTTAHIWDRIDRAAKADAPSTIEQSAAWLPADQQAIARRLATALRAPATLLAQADSMPDDARTRQALTLALAHYAHRHADQAQAAWNKLSARFAFDTEQRYRLCARCTGKTRGAAAGRADRRHARVARARGDRQSRLENRASGDRRVDAQ